MVGIKGTSRRKGEGRKCGSRSRSPRSPAWKCRFDHEGKRKALKDFEETGMKVSFLCTIDCQGSLLLDSDQELKGCPNVILLGRAQDFEQHCVASPISFPSQSTSTFCGHEVAHLRTDRDINPEELTLFQETHIDVSELSPIIVSTGHYTPHAVCADFRVPPQVLPPLPCSCPYLSEWPKDLEVPESLTWGHCLDCHVATACCLAVKDSTGHMCG